jgi:hypothetical protein
MKKSARGRRKSQHFGLSRQKTIIEKVNSWQSKKSARSGNVSKAKTKNPPDSGKPQKEKGE